MGSDIRKNYSFEWKDMRHLGILGLTGLFLHPALKLFFLFYLIDLFALFKQNRDAKEQEIDLTAYYRTMLYSQLNILQWPKILLQLLGQPVIIFRHRAGLPSPAGYTNKMTCRLPFNGRWKTLNGGTTRESSHSWDILTQRYAYDFVIWDENGKSFRCDGKNLPDHYCWGKEIVAVADGQVADIRNDVNDYTGVGDYSIDWKTRDFRGNFVVIRHAPGEYSFSAHLMKGSVAVKKGNHVKAGDIIGLCGNSGHSTEPHLHFHMQDSASFWISAGLPVRFACFRANSDVRRNSFIEKEELAEHCP